LPLGDLPGDETSVPIAVRLETDAPLDDIQIDLSGGATVYVQAKTKMNLSRTDKALCATFRQVGEAAKASPPLERRDRLVLAVKRTTAGMDVLFKAFLRAKNPLAGRPTRAEANALRLVDQLIPSLSPSERTTVHALTCGLRVSPESVTAAESVLAAGVVAPIDAPRAFNQLKSIARELAIQRFGLSIDGWAERLARDKIPLVCGENGTVAARWEARRRSVRRYRSDLVRRGRTLDLRGLGAAVPTIHHQLLRCLVYAGPRGRGGRDVDREVPLQVVARRNRRLLLLGLPGSGKSTALRHLAAAWALDPKAPLPLLVNLRDIVPLLPMQRPMDAIITAAAKSVRATDGGLLREEFLARARSGPVALFLDALDETREARFLVVQAIEQMLRDLDRDVTVVVSTRDSGYAAASTLGFAEARLKPIKTPQYTLSNVVEALSKRCSPSSANPAQWIQERLAWINRVLQRDRVLAETPLGGILLALLAAEPGRRSLPRGRAETLSAVVDGIVDRWELTHRNRSVPAGVGALTGTAAATALRESFAQIGYLLSGSGAVTAADVNQALCAWLTARWGLVAGPAEATARDVFSFWDEAGIFMASGASGTVAARLQVLAEIGAARYVAALVPDDVPAAIEGLAALDETFEIASLASGLCDVASRSLVRFCLAKQDLRWDLRAAKHLLEGARVPDDASQVARALASRAISASDKDRWAALKAVALLPAPTSVRMELVHSVREEISEVEYTLAMAICQYTSGRPLEAPEEVLEAASVKIRQQKARPGRSIFIALADDDDLADLLRYIAEDVLPSNLHLAQKIFDLSGETRDDVRSRIDAALIKCGRPDLARSRYSKMYPTYQQMAEISELWDRDCLTLLEMIGQLDKPRQPSFASLWRFDELADFIATLRFGTSGAAAVSMGCRHPRDLERLVKLVAPLGGFNTQLLATEARLAIELDDRDGTVWSLLLHGGSRRSLKEWNRSNGTRTIDDLLDLLRSSRWVARIASDALSQCRYPGVSDRIESVLSQLAPICRLYAGNAVIDIGAEMPSRANGWGQSADPFLRRLAAWWLSRTLQESALGEHLERSLGDVERGVRAAAIQGLRGRSLPTSVAERLKNDPGPLDSCGYVCLWCGTDNGPVRSCANCNTVGPEVASEVKVLLSGEGDDSEEDD
jgi:hypothetical protein